MKAALFSTLHGALLLALSFIPALADIFTIPGGINYSQLLGQEIAILSIIIALEIIALELSYFVPHYIGNSIRLLWALTILPITFIALVDFQLTSVINTHLDWATLVYAYRQFSDILPIIESELNPVILVCLFSAASFAVSLSISGWRMPRQRSRKVRLPYMSITATIFIALIISFSDSCPSSSTHTLIFAPTCSTARANEPSNIKQSISPYSQIANLKKFINLKPSIATPPSELQTTPNSKLDNIVIITLESFRTDAITPYTPSLDTTPFLNKLAKEGLKVNNGFVNFPHTSKSLTAINCGIPPYPTMKIRESTKNGLPFTCLPNLLKPLGYNTAFFQTATKNFENRTGLTKNMGYDKFVPYQEMDTTGSEKINYLGHPDKIMIKPVFNWVDEQEQPFLLSIMTIASHHNYGLPESFPIQKFGDASRWNKYLNAVHYTDTFIEEIFDGFEERGLLDNTLFVFVGDHGEGLRYFSKNHPYDLNIRIPMILWSKHLITKPMVTDKLSQHSDIIPTIADLFNLKPKDGTFYGQSIFQPDDHRNLNITCRIQDCQVLIAGDLTYLYSPENNTAELYDYKNDPMHTNNQVYSISVGTRDKINEYLLSWKNEIFKAHGVND